MSDGMLTAARSRAARALLGWTQMKLAKEALLGGSTVTDFENGKRVTTPANMEAIRMAFYRAGIRFGTNAIYMESEADR